MRTRSLSSLLVPGCATPPAPAPTAPATAGSLRFLRLHLDEAEAGAIPTLLAVRGEYRGWVQSHAPSPGEAPVLFVQLAKSQLWALRPTASWEEMPAQAAADGRTEERVPAAVGAALDENCRRMHGAIRAHRYEVLRLLPEISAGEPSLAAIAAQLVTVAVDLPVPARSEEYQQAAQSLASVERFHLVFLSSPGSGAFVHLLGTGEGPTESRLPDARLVRSRAVWHSSVHPELSALPAPR
ncbi:MAG TPA: hypothetical protein VLT82_22995 [Myxococcaceae bacterium]|nr:hypothetical protein [Myxococcaceae bacterium]